ncbi:MAG: tetratricopeptide repeat protein [Anaerolineae bacterium]|nr:tetratricopeptide repeat protein [Anaerolineae bacterium]
MRFAEMADAAEQAARIAEAGGLERALTDALRFMGYAYLHLDRRQEAQRPLQRALDMARASGDRAAIARTAMVMGMMYGEEHRLIEALAMFDEALALVRPSGDRLRTAAYLYNEGELFFRRGEADRAIAAYNEAIDIFRAIDARVMLGYALSGMCQVLCFAGQYGPARLHIDEAERIFAENDDEFGPFWCMSARGRDLERDLGACDAARDHLQTVVVSLGQTSYTDETLYALLALADVQVRLGALDVAEATLAEAGALIQTAQAHWFLPEHELVTGQLAMARDDPAAALDSARRALAAVGVNGDPRTLPAIYRLLARALQETGADDADMVHDALERSVAAARGRARKLDLALSLRALGQFLKQRADRPTNQARGSGYLFEADLLFSEMGIEPPA